MVIGLTVRWVTEVFVRIIARVHWDVVAGDGGVIYLIILGVIASLTGPVRGYDDVEIYLIKYQRFVSESD